jgi:RNA polymerase sigma-70 factor (ECF subfamily)
MPDSGSITHNDRLLWVGIMSDESPAMEELFRRHAKAVYNFCFRGTADWSSAEDLTSTTFLDLWRRRHDLHLEHESALPLLLGIAANHVRNHKRGVRRLTRYLGRASTDDTPDASDRVAERIDAEREMARVLAALATLSPGERDVLQLVAWATLSYEETATALGVPVGTVKSRLSRAREKLRDRGDLDAEQEPRRGHE